MAHCSTASFVLDFISALSAAASSLMEINYIDAGASDGKGQQSLGVARCHWDNAKLEPSDWIRKGNNRILSWLLSEVDLVSYVIFIILCLLAVDSKQQQQRLGLL